MCSKPLGVGATTRFVRLVGPGARQGDHHGVPAIHRRPRRTAWGLVHRVVPGSSWPPRCASTPRLLAAKPFAPLAQVKARINAIARTGIPEVNAMTEGYLPRE